MQDVASIAHATWRLLMSADACMDLPMQTAIKPQSHRGYEPMAGAQMFILF